MSNYAVFKRGEGGGWRPKKQEKSIKCMNIFLDDHAGDRSQNLSNSSRMPFHWATRSILGYWLYLSVLYHVSVIVSHLEYKIVSRFGDRESSRV